MSLPARITTALGGLCLLLIATLALGGEHPPSPLDAVLSDILGLIAFAQACFMVGVTAVVVPVYIGNPRFRHVILLGMAHVLLTIFSAYGIYTGATAAWWRILGVMVAYALSDYGVLLVLPSVSEYRHVRGLTLPKSKDE